MEKYNQKIRLLRVITQAEVVPWHLKNFIERAKNDYDLFIVGNDVEKYATVYPYITFINVIINRKTTVWDDVLALFKLIFIFLSIRPQIVHSIMPKAGFLAAIAGVVTFRPIRIHTFTGQVWATRKGISRQFYKFIDIAIFKMATRCLTDSPSQSIFLAKNGFLVGKHPIDFLGKGSLSGVSLDIFNRSIIKDDADLKLKLGINIEDFVFLFLARKSVIKGIEVLFESFASFSNIPDVKLLFIGPDESDGLLDKLYQKYTTNVTSKIIDLGIVDNHEKYLALSNVLCLPSSSEGFGSIVIEAAALGVPCVGFDIVGLRDSVENECSGILVPFGNTLAFSNAMFKLYCDKEYLSQMSLNAQQRVEAFFSADIIYSEQHLFYHTLIKSHLSICKELINNIL